MFQIEMLPAEHGDCLVVTYGTKEEPHRILIDGGTHTTFPRLKKYIANLPAGQRHFELLIVTHIDEDHIGGVLPLLRDTELGVSFGDIWFNAWHHLAPPRRTGFLGPKQGDLLGNLLSQRLDLPWNQRFEGGTVVVPDSGPLPVRTLPGGLRLTLLSPRWEELEKLSRSWSDKAFKSGRVPGDVSMLGGANESILELLGSRSQAALLAAQRFFPDTSAANGSSIAVLAEYEGKRALLAADAFAEVLVAGIKRLPGVRDTLRLDAFKLPHHGSQHNINDELLQVAPSRNYLISTNGNHFDHPDVPAMKRVLQQASEATLFFNYDSETTGEVRKLVRQQKSGPKKELKYPRKNGEDETTIQLLTEEKAPARRARGAARASARRPAGPATSRRG
ncbi:MAG TPA: MBL fold metallo-hydrolase [Myxococcaceae bacterium]|nr:MBL fold metallo-hydrolase [Myxococcaceae bacterium]